MTDRSALVGRLREIAHWYNRYWVGKNHEYDTICDAIALIESPPAGEIQGLVERAMALANAATPGPWAWFGQAPHSIHLATTNRGRVTVMGFRRHGPQGAQPTFQISGRMVPAVDLLQFEVGDQSVVGLTNARANESVYRYDVRGIAHANAAFIAASRQLIPELCEAITRLSQASGGRERIVRAAIKWGEAVYSVASPGRHGDVFRSMPYERAQQTAPDDQGFLTSTGRFLGRIGAKQCARDAGQLLPTGSKSDDLFSEDLW